MGVARVVDRADGDVVPSGDAAACDGRTCDGEHPGRPVHARTTLANPLERLFIAPFWVHYHCEHHCFMYVPCYNLERTHKLLVLKGYRDRMRITKGYVEVLRRCGSKSATAEAAA